MKKIRVRWDNIALLICIAFAVWFVASFVDVNIHNDICNTNYGDFSPWNIFKLIF